ncbi:MAG: mannitol dehydrogenase [Eubacteriales bacterium]|nr:mannitol dehydrogenase [Eubacteriales bacterium]
MKKAVIFGAGRIGRGFIGVLFSQSQFAVTFIDVVDTVVAQLQHDRAYPVRVVSNQGFQDYRIAPVDVIHGRETSSVAQAIAEADLLATAVGVNVLPQIVPNLIAGIRQRISTSGSGRPLNLIICENLMHADRYLMQLIKSELAPSEVAWVDQNFGLVEASVGRMIPVQTPDLLAGEPLRVCVEAYNFLPVDRAAFKGEIPEITNMIPYSPFDFYIKRKLFIHNMGHAICAYLGDYAGRTYIQESIIDADTLLIVQNAMHEGARALAKQFHVDCEPIILHIQDLINRFGNAALGDTCERVGGDPARKLAPDDRLVGAARLCSEMGITPVNICIGIAAAIFRYLRETNQDQSEQSATKAIVFLSQLEPHDPIICETLVFYRLLISGAPLSTLRNKAYLETAALGKPVI